MTHKQPAVGHAAVTAIVSQVWFFMDRPSVELIVRGELSERVARVRNEPLHFGWVLAPCRVFQARVGIYGCRSHLPNRGVDVVGGQPTGEHHRPW